MSLGCADKILQCCWLRSGSFLTLLPPHPSPATRDVSNDNLRQGSLDGLWKLQLTASLVSLAPLCLLHYLPKDEEEQQELALDTRRSKLGGALFLIVLVLSILWTIVTAVEKFYRF
jgi:hypothetical protein